MQVESTNLSNKKARENELLRSDILSTDPGLETLLVGGRG